MTILTNRSLVVTPATIARPAYLASVIEAEYGTKLTRITGDVGTPIPGLAPEDWDLDARHHYSKDNPWNCDGTLADLEQRGGSPSKFIVDAKTWKPIRGNTGNFRACGDSRWHPIKPTWMVGYNKPTRELVVFDTLTDQTIKRISVPFTFLSSNGGFMGEGSLSNDASMVALGDESNNVIMVDIANGRVSPVQKVAFVREPATGLDNITVSPLSTSAGGYVVCHGNDFVRVYKYGVDLVLVPHFESPLKLSHADVGVTPMGSEVFVGGARAYFGAAGTFSKKNGNIAAIFLDNGDIRNISAGENQLGAKEAADQHCSLRGPKGWVLVTYAGAQETSGRFLMELVAYKLDGSRDCIRFGVTRTNETGLYRAEAHGVMRPDGRAVMFASNFQWSTSARGATTDIKACVYELDGVSPPAAIEPAPVLERFYVDETRRAYPSGAIMDRVTSSPVMLSEIAKLLNGIKVTG